MCRLFHYVEFILDRQKKQSFSVFNKFTQRPVSKDTIFFYFL